jgi:amino acid exporter
MNLVHSSLLAVGLFALTFLSPGPNLVIVVQSSMSGGRAAGIATGVGVACGDAIYAALGLLGMAAVIAQSGALFHLIRIAGGVYLLWFAWQLVRAHPAARLDEMASRSSRSLAVHFRRGLMTDLANPQTVLFFASIFAITLKIDTPAWSKLLTWTGIVLASMLWRIGLSIAFSRPPVRRAYARWQRAIERAAGLALAAFGIRLLLEGVARR